jgi:long-chain fatty acid transport protein
MNNKMIMVSAVGACLALMAGQVGATNGYFTHGVGTHNKAMAGAGDASPTMAIDAANNPAAGVLVDQQWNVGIGVFSPYREYKLSDSAYMGQGGSFTLQSRPGEVAGKVESDNNFFPIPYIAYNWRLNEASAMTISFYGRGGMNTEYNGAAATFDPDGPGPAPVMTLPGTYGAGTAGVDLMQAFLEFSYSRQVGALSLGVAPVIAYQMFEAKGVGTFAPYTKTYAGSYMATGMPEMPTNLTNNGSDTSAGIGFKVGGIWSASDRVALSLAYQSKISMGEFDDYSDLFAEAGGFDIPASARAGISFRPKPNLGYHFDVEHIFFSDVDSVGNPLANVMGCPTAGMGGMNVENCLGGNQGFGFGWDDMTVLQFGVDYAPESSPGITWRFGYSYGEQPIQSADATINILAPAVMEHHFTAGFSMERANGNEFSVAVMYAPERSVSGSNFFDPSQQVELSMHQFELEIAYRF